MPLCLCASVRPTINTSGAFPQPSQCGAMLFLPECFGFIGMLGQETLQHAERPWFRICAASKQTDELKKTTHTPSDAPPPPPND